MQKIKNPVKKGALRYTTYNINFLGVHIVGVIEFNIMTSVVKKNIVSLEREKELEHTLLTVKKLFNKFYGRLEERAKELGLACNEKGSNKSTEKVSAAEKCAEKGAEKNTEKGTDKKGSKRSFIPQTEEQQKGLATAAVILAHPEEKNMIATAMDVSIPTVDKYLSLLVSAGNEDLVKIVKPNGRPRIYPVEVDVQFIEWASDESIPYNETTMGDLIMKYVRLLKPYSAQTRKMVINLDGVRQHVYLLLRFMNWCMVTPATVDLQRCAIFDRMVDWFEDAEVEHTLTSVDKMLLFNGDETYLTLNEKKPNKILWRRKGCKNTAVVPRDRREQQHISVYLTVSAAGQIMRPFVFLSSLVKNFDVLKHSEVAYYHAPDGYMTKDIFYLVMKEVFVKYVEHIRSYYNLVGRKAALVVDGHISRYTVRTVNLLMEHNIDLVILPSHSSHVMQPLDLGLFAYIKRVFRTVLGVTYPVFPLKAKSRGRPAKECKVPLEKLSNPQFEEYMRQLNADMLRGVKEEPEETQARIERAPYQRAKVIEAVIDAISSLKPSAIRHAWSCCHLYPFYGSPNYTRDKELKLLKQIPKAEKEFLLKRNKETPVAEATEVTEVKEGANAIKESSEEKPKDAEEEKSMNKEEEKQANEKENMLKEQCVTKKKRKKT